MLVPEQHSVKNRLKITFLLISFCFIVIYSVIGHLNKTNVYGTVIILNGTSASGKTSIAKAFQAKRAEPWLNIGIDNFFVGVLPSKFYLEDKPEHHSVFWGVASEDEQGKLFKLSFGDEGRKIIKGMHRAIAEYAKQGNNIIVDYITYEPEWREDFLKVLSGINIITIGVTAALPIIEQREKMRGTSPEGHARSVYYTVHNGWDYDLEINTDEITPSQAAERIDNYLS